jgi:hypothetical protein
MQESQTPVRHSLTDQELKEKEMLLWQELRDLRNLTLRLLQWSVTVMAALQTTIFFFRKDLYGRLLAAGTVGPGQSIPLSRYLLGTIYLTIVASVFAAIMLMAGNRYRKIRTQLVNINIYQIEYGDVRRSARPIMLLILYAFPLLDLFIRFYFRIELGFD